MAQETMGIYWFLAKKRWPEKQKYKCMAWSFSDDLLEKGKATHSSILAWRIPWTEEPGRLQSMGSQRIGHDWVTNTLTVCTSHCRPYFPLCALRTGTGRQHASGSSTGLTIRQTGLSDPASVTAWLHDHRQATYSPPTSAPSSVKWVLVCTFCNCSEGQWGV